MSDRLPFKNHDLNDEERVVASQVANLLLDMMSAKLMVASLLGNPEPGTRIEAGAAIHAIEKDDRAGALRIANVLYKGLSKTMPQPLEMFGGAWHPSLQLVESKVPEVLIGVTFKIS
jgi:hypothetical protein